MVIKVVPYKQFTVITIIDMGAIILYRTIADYDEVNMRGKNIFMHSINNLIILSNTISNIICYFIKLHVDIVWRLIYQIMLFLLGKGQNVMKYPISRPSQRIVKQMCF